MQKITLDHLPIPHTKINSKWIRDLNIRHESIKSQKKTGSKISDITHSNILLDIPSQAKDKKEKINKWDNIKLKSFCKTKEIISKIRRKPTEKENIFTDTSDKGFISKIYLKIYKIQHTHKNPIKKMGKGPEQTLLQRGHPDGQQTYETLLNTTDYQRDAN